MAAALADPAHRSSLTSTGSQFERKIFTGSTLADPVASNVHSLKGFFEFSDA